MIESLLVRVDEMKTTFSAILRANGFSDQRSALLAEIFTNNSVDGVYTHGVNRFPRFISNVRTGLVIPEASPSLTQKFHGLQQWEGNLGPGPLNAIQGTDTATELASEYGIGAVMMARTNHWMRGGTYGWHAAKKGYVFIGWTNTIANMPAWGAMDAKLGNNPLVLAIPYQDEAIVLDMAMSQYSFGAMELATMRNEELPVYSGFSLSGDLTKNPSEILQSKRPLPIGYWKGAGLSLLLDILATVLSGGWSTAEISSRDAEYGLSQVFIAIDIRKLGNASTISSTIGQILDDYRKSTPEGNKQITFPGERVLSTRKKNRENGIPVLKKVWDEVLSL